VHRRSVPHPQACGWLQAAALALAEAALACILLLSTPSAYAQTEKLRPVRVRVRAVYPELARHFNLTGTVKLRVVVATNGHVKSSASIGGNPVLVQAAMDAVKHWEFEPAKEETTEVVQFTFIP